MSVTYFLKIDGIVGDSTDAKHAGWFEINGYDWGITSTATGATGTGGGSGTAEISDLLIDLALDAKGLPTLLKDAATGEHIASVELQGVKDDGKGSFAFYDLKLDDVLVTDVADSAGSHDTLALNFGEVELTTTTQKPDGSPGTPETFKFDVQANTQALALAADNPGLDGGGRRAGEMIDRVPTGERFFLKIDGIVGDSTRTPSAQAGSSSTIDGYDWGITSTATGATGTGGGERHGGDLRPADRSCPRRQGPADPAEGCRHRRAPSASVELQGVEDDEQRVVRVLRSQARRCSGHRRGRRAPAATGRAGAQFQQGRADHHDAEARTAHPARRRRSSSTCRRTRRPSPWRRPRPRRQRAPRRR